MKIVVKFRTNGTVLALHDDDINMQGIGRVLVKRASTIEYNHDKDEWEVILAGGKHPSFSHGSRNECLRWERSHLQESM